MLGFLGHVVGDGKLEPESDKLKAVREWEKPTDRKRLQAFLGFCGYYRHFVKGFSKIVAPLSSLLKKSTHWAWSPECNAAFETIRDALANPEILHLPTFKGTMTIDCDASNEAIGAVLSEEIDGEEYPVEFASRTLGSAERNYCATRRELLALVCMGASFEFGRIITL